VALPASTLIWPFTADQSFVYRCVATSSDDDLSIIPGRVTVPQLEIGNTDRRRSHDARLALD
jgi:hypothetical protein